MQENSSLRQAWLWFGAAVSLAEIMTGAMLAPLGPAKALMAIVSGHLLGGSLMFAVVLLSAQYDRSAMETARLAFGRLGANMFAFLNILQLVGWTAVMIAAGAACANAVCTIGTTPWSLILGAGITTWIALGLFRSGIIGGLTVGAMLTVIVFSGIMLATYDSGFSATPPAPAEGFSFGDALELSMAMPLSWLPVAGDYLCGCQHPKRAAATACGVYGLTSVMMYTMGLALATTVGGSDIGTFLSGMGFIGPALALVVLSTVTTTFMDAYSAGVSARSLVARLSSKTVAVSACLIGTLLAVAVSPERYEAFLYLIGSVFAPMATVMVISTYVFHRNVSASRFDLPSCTLWFAGTILYHVCLRLDPPCGSSLPAIAVLCILAWIVYSAASPRH